MFHKQGNDLTEQDADGSESSEPEADMASETIAKIVAISNATNGLDTDHEVATPKPAAEVGVSVTVVASEIAQVPRTSIPDVQAEADFESQPETETVELKPSPTPTQHRARAGPRGRACRAPRRARENPLVGI